MPWPLRARSPVPSHPWKHPQLIGYLHLLTPPQPPGVLAATANLSPLLVGRRYMGNLYLPLNFAVNLKLFRHYRSKIMNMAFLFCFALNNLKYGIG